MDAIKLEEKRNEIISNLTNDEPIAFNNLFMELSDADEKNVELIRLRNESDSMVLDYVDDGKIFSVFLFDLTLDELRKIESEIHK